MKKIILISCLVFYFFSVGNSQTVPDDVRKVNVSIPSPNVSVAADVGIYYKNCGSSSSLKKITKPFIMIEGYDLPGSMNLNYFYNNMYFELFYNLRADGWDVILIDLNNNNTLIQSNAELLKKVIRDINTEVEQNNANYGTPIFRPTVMGYSMGGLIARYALADMEHNGEDHKVDNLICWDSPNRGANIPLSIQHLFSWSGLQLSQMFYTSQPSWMQSLSIKNKLNGIMNKSFGIDFFQDACMQMSLNYTTNNRVRYNFLADMDRIGRYPNNCRRIGIANGSNGIPQARPAWVDRNLFYWHGGICLADWTWGKFNIRYCPAGFGVDLYRVPGAIVPPLGVTYLGVGQDIGVAGASVWTVPFSIAPSPLQYLKTTLDMDFLNLPRNNGNPIVDIEAGSYLSGWNDACADLSNSVKEFPQIDASIPIKVVIPGGCAGYRRFKICWRDIVLVDTKIPIKMNPAGRVEYKPFTFVPTVSALDVQTNDLNLWNYNVASLGRYPKKVNTPFDVVAFNSVNSHHTSNYPRARLVIQDEVSPVNLFIQNKNFANNYKNSFQARGTILIGNDVDKRADSLNASNIRIPQGNVVVNGNANINFIAGDNEFVYFVDGFETSSDFVGEVNVGFQSLSCSYTNETSMPASVTRPIDSKYKTLRTASSEADNTSTNQIANKLPNPTEGKFDESAADAKHKAIYEQTVAQAYQSKSYISPNPIVNDVTNLFFTLNNTSVVTVKIYDINGREKLQMSLGSFNEGLNQTKLDLSALNEGNYICQVITASYTEMHKFVKK